jgi:hypothetical protein
MVRRRRRLHIVRQTVGVEVAFATILIVVVILAAVVALVIAIQGTSKLYDSIGKGAFALDQPDNPPGPQPGSAAAQAEAQEEIRQLVEAKSARRVARGESPLDVEAEVHALTRPPDAPRDDALREEVRQLVVARNERRIRKGQEPLDVEAEVKRQMRDLG